MEDLAADLEALAERLDLEDLVVVGWSLGAQVALRAYPALARRVRGVVLVAGTPRFTATDDFPHALSAVAARAMHRRLRRDHVGTLQRFFQTMFAPGELSEGQCRSLAREVLSPIPGKETLGAALSALEDEDLREVLPEIACPVLLIHGTADAICFPQASRYMAERLPKARLAWVAGCGHAPFLSQPEDFHGEVERWLDEIQGAN